MIFAARLSRVTHPTEECAMRSVDRKTLAGALALSALCLCAFAETPAAAGKTICGG